MIRQSPYYEHSGIIGIFGPLLMILFGIVGAVVGGAIYGYLIFYIPFIYFNFFITLGFGALVGYLVGMGAKIGKIRNSTFTVIGGLTLGLVAEYVGWVSWIFAASKQSALALHPEALWLVIRDVAESGAWSIFGWTPTGFALYLIWFIELLMIVVTAGTVAMSLIARPFCERCQKWAADLEDSPNLEPIQDPEHLKTGLEQADYSSLEAMGKAEPGASLFTKLSFSTCPSCKREYYLTVKTVKVTVDSKGKESKSEKDVLTNLILSPEIHQRLLDGWRSQPIADV